MHVGYQSLAFLSEGERGARMGSPEKAVDNYVRGHGEYWELWDGNGRDPAICQRLLETIAQSRAALPTNAK